MITGIKVPTLSPSLFGGSALRNIFAFLLTYWFVLPWDKHRFFFRDLFVVLIQGVESVVSFNCVPAPAIAVPRAFQDEV